MTSNLTLHMSIWRASLRGREKERERESEGAAKSFGKVKKTKLKSRQTEDAKDNKK